MIWIKNFCPRPSPPVATHTFCCWQFPYYACDWYRFSTLEGLPIVWLVFRVRALSLDCWGLLLHSAPWLHRPPACNSYSHQAPSDSLSAEQTLSAELQRQSARWKAEQKHQQRHHRAHLIIARAKKQQTVCLSWERILHGTLWQTKPAFCASPLPVPISKRLDILLFQGLTILFYHSLMIGNTTKSKLNFELFAIIFGPHME